MSQQAISTAAIAGLVAFTWCQVPATWHLDASHHLLDREGILADDVPLDAVEDGQADARRRVGRGLAESGDQRAGVRVGHVRGPVEDFGG